MRQSLFLILFLFALTTGTTRVLPADSSTGYAKDTNAPVFSTWDTFEADKCASIWLLQRFVDRNALIKFFPKGEPITEGVPFDTPDSQLRRYHNMATFESILRHYDIKNPTLVYIGKIIHDIEINVWQRKAFKETLIVQEEVNRIIQNADTSNDIIEKSNAYFDSLYKTLKSKHEVVPK